jgi:hypothetical protein
VRKLNKIEDISRKQHALDKKTSIIGPMKENEAAVARDAMDGITYVSVDLVTHNVS